MRRRCIFLVLSIGCGLSSPVEGWEEFVSTIMKILFLLALAFLLPSKAFAEGGACPSGYYPIGGGSSGWSGCAPISGGSGANEEPADPGPLWLTRWGSVAIDSQTGGFGGSAGQATKRSAEKFAIAQCKSRGGKRCLVVKTVRNTCQALAWGDSKASVMWRSTQRGAEDEALGDCNAHTQHCDLYFSGCSYPERRR